MNRAHQDDFARRVESRYPDWDDKQRDAFCRHFAGFDYDVVDAALTKHLVLNPSQHPSIEGFLSDAAAEQAEKNRSIPLASRPKRFVDILRAVIPEIAEENDAFVIWVQFRNEYKAARRLRFDTTETCMIIRTRLAREWAAVGISPKAAARAAAWVDAPTDYPEFRAFVDDLWKNGLPLAEEEVAA